MDRPGAGMFRFASVPVNTRPFRRCTHHRVVLYSDGNLHHAV